MKRLPCACVLLLLALGAPRALGQPDENRAVDDDRDPTFKHWKTLFELQIHENAEGPFIALPISPEIFGKSQVDIFSKDGGELRDLRLADAKGNRIPFDIRNMRSIFQRTDVRIKRTFNAAESLKSRVYEASYELENIGPQGHNEIEIHMVGGGRNYRRKVEVFADDNGKFTKPRALLGKGKYLVHYEVDGKIVDVRRFRYEFMQLPFIQVRVHADDVTVDEEIPIITDVKVRRTIESPGEYVTESANANGPELRRRDGFPATAWLVNLPDRIPCEKLVFEINGEPSEREMRLEVADEKQEPRPIFVTEWRWRKADPRAGEENIPNRAPRYHLETQFEEVIARRIRLVVIDKANEPLNISNNVQATRAVRKLVFEKPDRAKTALPLRLYADNSAVGPPGYVDLRKKLSELPLPWNPAPAIATQAGPAQPNPTYEAPPQPLHERAPWLVHVVLGAASLVLLLILAALVRQAIQRHDQSVIATAAP